jgi:hypothetical protein
VKVDFVEINEAFSVVAVANVQLLQLDPGTITKKEKTCICSHRKKRADVLMLRGRLSILSVFHPIDH